MPAFVTDSLSQVVSVGNRTADCYQYLRGGDAVCVECQRSICRRSRFSSRPVCGCAKSYGYTITISLGTVSIHGPSNRIRLIRTRPRFPCCVETISEKVSLIDDFVSCLKCVLVLARIFPELLVGGAASQNG